MIIGNKQGVYELPHELPNNLILRNLRKLGKAIPLCDSMWLIIGIFSFFFLDFKWKSYIETRTGLNETSSICLFRVPISASQFVIHDSY